MMINTITTWRNLVAPGLVVVAPAIIFIYDRYIKVNRTFS